MSRDLTWKAIYDDSTHLWECNPAGEKINKYDDIDRTKLVQFQVFHPKNLELPIITVDIKEGYQLIWRKRRWQHWLERQPFRTVYLIGWHTNINGRNIASIMYLHENGQVELSDGKSDLELRECELIK